MVHVFLRRYSFDVIPNIYLMITKLYTTESGSIDFDPSVPCLISTYNGFIGSEDFRNQGEFGLEMIQQKIRKYGKIAWIGDLSKSEIFDDEDVEWTGLEWSTKAYALGLHYRAIVMPESVFAAINVRDFIARHDERKDPLIIKSFTDIASAKAWCKQCLDPLSVGR
jgi:hypothetical protein